MREKEKIKIAASRIEKVKLARDQPVSFSSSDEGSSSDTVGTDKDQERARIFNDEDEFDENGEPVDKLQRVYTIRSFKDVRKIVTEYKFRVFEQSYMIRFPNTKYSVKEVINIVFIFRHVISDQQMDDIKLKPKKVHTINLS